MRTLRASSSNLTDTLVNNSSFTRGYKKSCLTLATSAFLFRKCVFGRPAWRFFFGLGVPRFFCLFWGFRKLQRQNLGLQVTPIECPAFFLDISNFDFIAPLCGGVNFLVHFFCSKHIFAWKRCLNIILGRKYFSWIFQY